MREFYWDDDSCVYRDIPYSNDPTDLELLKIFPEAKSIIPQKIDAWLRVKRKLLYEEVIPILKKIEAIPDDFSRFFWKEAYKVLINPRFIDAVNNLNRLKRLQLFLIDNTHTDRVRNFEKKKEIARQMPITEFYSFQKLRKKGRRFTALCPFHPEKTPSFTIYENNSWHCFGCGKGGDVIDFVERIKDCKFKEAVKIMAGDI